MKDLAALQRSFQRHVYRPGRAMERSVLATPRANAGRRLGVYADGYRARLVEALGTDDDDFARIEDNLAAGTAPLRPRERQALRLRFHEGLTQREIGVRIGISQMQVSRTLNAALQKLLAAVSGGEELAEPA